MKILGVNGEKRVVECTTNELANILGLYSTADRGCPRFQAGDEVNVSDLYQRAYRMASNYREVTTIRTACHAILKSVDKIQPIVEKQKELEVG